MVTLVGDGQEQHAAGAQDAVHRLEYSEDVATRFQDTAGGDVVQRRVLRLPQCGEVFDDFDLDSRSVEELLRKLLSHITLLANRAAGQDGHGALPTSGWHPSVA